MRRFQGIDTHEQDTFGAALAHLTHSPSDSDGGVAVLSLRVLYLVSSLSMPCSGV
jgi:hypothetical protein